MAVGRVRAGWAAVAACGLLFLGGVASFPARTYLDKRDEVSSAERRADTLQAQNDQLAATIDKLGTDAELERLAREQYGLVKPGEESYRVLPAPRDLAAAPEVWPFTRLDPQLDR
jgi:cell division protein FtsB